MAFEPVLIDEYMVERSVEDRSVLCHAPFTNLNFGQDGRARACCYNGRQSLGCYPRDSIHEIWFGKTAQALRSEMGRDRLPEGCELCAQQLMARDFVGLKAKTYDQYAMGRPIPILALQPEMPKCIEFELSNLCNLQCTMCDGFFSSSIRRNVEKLPPLPQIYDHAFVEQLDEFLPHLVEAKFLGGEPFLIPLYYAMWDRIAEVNARIRVGVTTNGTILNKRVRAVLERLDTSIVVSVDAPDASSYERIRVGARFETVVRNLRYFAEYTKQRGRQLTIAACPMRQNWRSLPHLLDFCDQFEAELHFNTVWQPSDATLRTLSATELDTVVAHLRDGLGRNSSQDVRRGHNESRYAGMLRQVETWAATARDAERHGPHVQARYERWDTSLASTEPQDAAVSSEVLALVREMLRAAAYQEDLGPIDYDPETLWSSGDQHLEYGISKQNAVIASLLDDLYQRLDAQGFLLAVFEAVRQVAVVLDDTIHLSKDADINRIMAVRDGVLAHSGSKVIASALRRAPCLLLLRIFTEIPLKELMVRMHAIAPDDPLVRP